MLPYHSRSAEFNSSFLIGDVSAVNWSDKNKIISPGNYDFDIYVNSEWIGKYRIKITSSNHVEIDRQDLSTLGIAGTDKIIENTSAEKWVDLKLLTHGGNVAINSALFRIDVTVPQAYVEKKNTRWISPSKWDSGINGLYSTYNASYYHAWRKDGISDTDNIYLTLGSGLNISEWHVIDHSVFRKNRANRSGSWTNNERYIERILPQFHSVFRAGDSNTSSSIFDNLRFRGVTFQQEQRMYPDEYRVYMPVIRSTAKSNATVRVYQDSNIIYQVNVPPGPFAINDLMPTGSRNDMTVVVQNDDGSSESFTVLYSTVSDMLRAGSSEWMVNAGQVLLKNVDYHPDFIQGNIAHGLSNVLTLYGGGTLSNKYQSVLAGTAFSVPWFGSFSVNADSANSNLENGKNYHGQRYKISWSRYFPTRTNLTLANYYYQSQNYLSFYDSVTVNALIQGGYGTRIYRRNKHKFSINLEQTLPEDWGKLTLRGYWRTYWNSSKKTNEYSLAWNNAWRNVNYTMAISRIHYEYEDSYAYVDSYEYDESGYGIKRRDENQINLSLTIPFTVFEKQANLTSNLVTKNGKYSSLNTGISGATQTVDYSVNLMDNHTSSFRSGSVYAGWRTPWSKMTGNYTEATTYRQAGASASGTVLLWRNGLLTSSQTGNTFVILDAPGAANAIVNGNASIRTNSRGQVLVPSAAAYRMNNFRIAADKKTDQSSAEILGNIGYSVPWHGSISYIKYKTDRRQTFIFSSVLNNGKAIPFGATVLDKNYQETGYVAQGSQIYLKSEKMPDNIYVRYTDEKSNKIHVCFISQPSTKEGVRNECKIKK